MATSVAVTELHLEVAGDAYAPELGPQWKEESREHHTAASGLAYSLVRYRRAG
jgi:dihydrofolate reductase